MKSKLYLSGLLLLAAIASCQKEMPVETATEENGTKVSLFVSDNIFSDSKTSYTSGLGVNLEGTEKMSLYYIKDGDARMYGSQLASPTGTPGMYSFTVPEGAGKAKWLAVMPYSSSLVGINGDGTAMSLRLGPVQFPKANSFDPQADILVGQPFELDVTAGENSASIASFKRLFAPLRIKVKGLQEGEKIYAFTIASDQAPTSTVNESMNSIYYFTPDDDFANANITNGTVGSIGNAMSAVYKDGLAAVDGSWPVWLVVNPTTLATNSHLTFTVSTQTKTYTRTITLTSAMEFLRGELNNLTININGAGCVSSNTTTYLFLDSQDNGWTMTDKHFYSEANSVLPSGTLYFQGGTFTFPDISGMAITKARIYSHPSGRFKSDTDISLTVDGTDKYEYNLRAETGSLAYNGGVIEVTPPAGKTSLAGLTVASTSNGRHMISAITLEVSADPNDYYAQFMAGQDIVINGEVYNNKNYSARCVKADELTVSEFIKNVGKDGILFIDDSVSSTVDFSETARIRPGNIVVIGRFRDSQPVINLAAGAIITTGHNIYKNIGFVSSYSYCLFANSLETDDNSVSHTYNKDLVVEDSSIYYTGTTSLIRDSNTAHCFSKVVFNNCVISNAGSVIYQPYTDASPAATGLELIQIKNSVIMSKDGAAKYLQLFDFKTKLVDTANMAFVFQNNTLYNIWQNPVLQPRSVKKANVDSNIYCVNNTGNCALFGLANAIDLEGTGSTCSGNYCYSMNDRENTYGVAYGYSAIVSTYKMTITPANIGGLRACDSKPLPFSSSNTATGYFPVNTTVVTNGAGASYDTKLWRSW